jgi:hypothetical protein
MAAIDKIYVNSYKDYLEFKDWCEKQPPLYDKYDKEARLIDYVYKYNEPFNDICVPIFRGPYYADAYLIRNCPFDYIQKELMVNYGHWSQERIKEFYESVKNWNGDGECPYWAKLEDFITLDDGTMIIKGHNEKSDYERIKDGELYTSPRKEDYEYGKHFRCIKHPKVHFNRPFDCKWWSVSVDVPCGYEYVWYHSNHNSWDFSSEFVIADWSSSDAFVKTIKALKRLMIKWKLPIGSKVRAIGKYRFDEYEFIITK